MNTQQFFDHLPTITEELSYEDTGTLIDMCDIFSMSNNISTFIIDFAQQGFLHVSPHPLFLLGYSQQEVMNMGYNFYKEILLPEDFHKHLQINKIGFGIFNTLALEDRKSAHFAYSFYVKHKSGRKILINHKFTPLRFALDGSLWLAICFVRNSPYKEPGDVVFSTNKGSKHFRYNWDTHKMTEYYLENLTPREQEILHLSMRGYNEHQIAEELHCRVQTIKNHRQKIIQKMGVHNLSNAITMFSSVF
ncbi:MAG: LuxR C-terminal-related transcriptional regulator [Bacteroidales bacterium]|nr:LuxR C-terminal-related transcriptional regulator [Bacteroidales bacterium]